MATEPASRYFIFETSKLSLFTFQFDILIYLNLGVWPMDIVPHCLPLSCIAFSNYSPVAYCDEPERPPNGVVTVYGRMTSSVATYSCNDGYILSGDSTRVCLGSGRWSGSDATCTGMYNYGLIHQGLPPLIEMCCWWCSY